MSDLEKAKENFLNGSNPTGFQLAETDVSRLFQIPQRLYGRAQELLKLETYFENTTNGAVEFCLVSGYSGVGKSVLVQELGRSIAKKTWVFNPRKIRSIPSKRSICGHCKCF
ncbi:AAA family ATPase [Algoriphagus boritolerans]|uniref:AAA family ATPase n=1 Tax=Algoriphagus boritolerans TaxID=308111 RepID=UPI003A0FC11F